MTVVSSAVMPRCCQSCSCPMLLCSIGTSLQHVHKRGGTYHMVELLRVIYWFWCCHMHASQVRGSSVFNSNSIAARWVVLCVSCYMLGHFCCWRQAEQYCCAACQYRCCHCSSSQLLMMFTNMCLLVAVAYCTGCCAATTKHGKRCHKASCTLARMCHVLSQHTCASRS